MVKGDIFHYTELDQYVYDMIWVYFFRSQEFRFSMILFACFIKDYYFRLPITEVAFENQDIIYHL